MATMDGLNNIMSTGIWVLAGMLGLGVLVVVAWNLAVRHFRLRGS